ncbi:MAG: DUF5916 domain-containing protein [Gemmatimonadota bacterium]|nr:DUF5916 domain-containing protein [Gemmatimonadota bacterium]
MIRTVLALAAVLTLLPAGAVAQEPGTSSATEAPPDSLDHLVTPPAGTPAHEREAPTVAAVRVEGGIDVDGRLDEPVWRTAPAATRFLQREPDEGEPATQRTEVRFAYDDETLYVGARMYDEMGAEGVTSRLVRRDARAESDRLTLRFDTFLDHLGQTRFSVNPQEVRGDAYGPAGSHPDDSWDPVWSAEAEIDSLGWTAELAIPFSQLRFAEGADQEWGLQIEREVSRLNERQVWSFWRLDESGGPSRYGHLTGITAPAVGVDRLELLPYLVAQTESTGEVDEEDPFDLERESTLRVGADLKYLVSSDFTLDATLNPDFGQVEVDPAVVNLSAFETFFPEKREFFIANRGLFSFGGFNCYFCSNVSPLSMLFTRRIGRAPQATSLAFERGRFVDIPDNTTILGAAKLTGRTRGGTSVGILGALTEREEAEVADLDGNVFEQEVEPLTGYFVGRVKHDLLDGDLQVGGIATSVARNFDDPALERVLPAHSEGLGVDTEWWWGDRSYSLRASAAFTNVSGSEEAILALQRSSARYFQRPDRDHGSNGVFTDRFDPTLESMRGYGFYGRVAKESGNWRWEGAVSGRSPGFENNDIAFLTRTDYVWMNGNVVRRWTEPTAWFRQLNATVGAQQQFNYDGDLVDRQFHGSVFLQTPFYWNTHIFGIVRPSTLDDRLTRGGPVVRSPDKGFLAGFVGTDRRKPVSFTLNPSLGWNEEGARDWSVRLGVDVRPVSNVSLSVGPRFSHSESTDQFVTSREDPVAEDFFGRRYVFSDLEQTTVSFDTRLDWTFTPTLSLELFAQPFVSSNDFSRFKEFAAPRRLEKRVYGEDVGTIRPEGEDAFVIDPDGTGPAEAFTISDPDFNFRSLRGNLVLRWEYLPGSTFFFVWTQDRRSRIFRGDFDFRRDFDELFEAEPDDIFLVKATYWLGI